MPLARHANQANTSTSPHLLPTHSHLSPHRIDNCTATTMPPPRLSSALLRARPQANYQCLRRITPLRRASTTPPSHNDIKPVVPWKTPMSVWSPENLIPPPKDGEILLERRPNRALPPYVFPPLSKKLLLCNPYKNTVHEQKKTQKKSLY